MPTVSLSHGQELGQILMHANCLFITCTRTWSKFLAAKSMLPTTNHRLIVLFPSAKTHLSAEFPDNNSWPLSMPMELNPPHTMDVFGSASILGQVLCIFVTQTPQLPSRHTLEEYMLKIHSILNFSLRLPACSFMSWWIIKHLPRHGIYENKLKIPHMASYGRFKVCRGF